MSPRWRDAGRPHVNGPNGSVLICWVSSSIARIITLPVSFVTPNGAALKWLPLRVTASIFSGTSATANTFGVLHEQGFTKSGMARCQQSMCISLQTPYGINT